MGEWDAWIGREQRATDRLDEGLARRWLATFDLDQEQAVLPQGIHFAMCTPEAPTAALGEDGHPAREESADSFLPVPHAAPDVGIQRNPLHRPHRTRCRDRTHQPRCLDQREKGGSGKLAFVDVEHETHANGTLSVRETQTLVYREAAALDAPLSPPELGEGNFDPSEWDAHRAIAPDPRLLFRYSALTFNTHRIHYDAPYAKEVERYRGLVVHGPLTASLLLQLAARELGANRLRHFEFRGVSPAIAGEPLHLVLRKSDDGYDLGAFAADGRQVTKAHASL